MKQKKSYILDYIIRLDYYYYQKKLLQVFFSLFQM